MGQRVLRRCTRAVVESGTHIRVNEGTYVQAAESWFVRFGSDFEVPNKKPGKDDRVLVISQEEVREPEPKVVTASKQKIVTGEKGEQKNG